MYKKSRVFDFFKMKRDKNLIELKNFKIIYFLFLFFIVIYEY